MAGDGDIFVIVTLWLIYIGIHVIMDFCERRARMQAELIAEEEGRGRVRGIYAHAVHGEGTTAAQQRQQDGHRGSSRMERSLRVVVVGAETDAAGSVTAEPCEGALVPDASGHLPKLPAPVQYGEASYAARENDGKEVEDGDAAVHVAAPAAEEAADVKMARYV